MAKGTFSVTISAPDIKPTLAAFSKLGKEANDELRDASTDIAEKLVPKVKAAANNKMRRKVAESVRVKRDRVPVVVAGAPPKLAGVLVAGSEFGGGQRIRTVYTRRNRVNPGTHPVYRRHTTMQFGPHTGNEGTWFFPTFRDNEDEILDEWRTAVDDLLTKWASSG